MNFKSLILFFSVLVASCSSVTEMEHVHTMTSPDGRLEMIMASGGGFAISFEEKR